MREGSSPSTVWIELLAPCSAEDIVLTSDPDDIKRILRSRAVRATVRRV
jgi:hypothetical protein